MHTQQASTWHIQISKVHSLPQELQECQYKRRKKNGNTVYIKHFNQDYNQLNTIESFRVGKKLIINGARKKKMHLLCSGMCRIVTITHHSLDLKNLLRQRNQGKMKVAVHKTYCFFLFLKVRTKAATCQNYFAHQIFNKVVIAQKFTGEE